MMLRRDRHVEMDYLRTINRQFNHAWHLFFGTIPPGIHSAAVFFTAEETSDLTAKVQTLTDADVGFEVEPYIVDGKKCKNTMDGLHASLPGEGVTE